MVMSHQCLRVCAQPFQNKGLWEVGFDSSCTALYTQLTALPNCPPALVLSAVPILPLHLYGVSKVIRSLDQNSAPELDSE